jgi:hypothetical protein
VKNDQGKSIGKIDQLIVDPTEGKITHVVIGRGGVLGVGARKVVLAWTDVRLQPDPDNRTRMTAMIEQSRIDSAPRYESRRDRPTSPAASPSTEPRPTTRPRS